MNRARLLLALLSASLSFRLGAAEPSAPAAATAPAPALTPGAGQPGPAPSPNQEVLVLPKIQVTSGRIRELDKEITRLDKLIAREQKQVKSSDLDRTLNNKKLSTAAAVFGGNSSEHLSAIAASRVSIMQAERSILEDMKRPISPEALAALETELDQLRLTRRNLDNVNVPH